MAVSMDALLRVSAKVQGKADLHALGGVFGNLQSAVGGATSALQGFAREKSWRDSMAAKTATVAAFAAGLVFATKSAVDFESSMSDVRKVVEGIKTPRDFALLRGEIMQLSQELPISAKGFADIYAAAGQSGIARGELRQFAELVGRVGVAFDISMEEAGVALSQLKVALNLSNAELALMADAMNHVSNVTGASAAQMVEFMGRAGSVGKLAGLSGQQTMAFGAAMIQAGTDTEVAATSFRNMLQALSKGPSMTDRQINALGRLGYSMVDAAQKESDLTRMAEREGKYRLSIVEDQGEQLIRTAEDQSQMRLDIERNETDKILREISRRYRAKLQQLQDNWEDETNAYEEALRDQTDAQIKGLQRQQKQEASAARKRAEAMNISNDEEIQAIEDNYDSKIEALRDAQEQELKVRRRADRNRQQEIRDGLQAQEEAEQDAARKRFQAVERQENDRIQVVRKSVQDRYDATKEAEDVILQKARADAKKTGEQLSDAATQGFADRLQKEGQGVIIEVLGRIAKLPKSQQVSVISDLFGDEARGLPSLLSNLGELQRILGEVGKQQQYAGSVTKESEIRFQTSAAQLQLFSNNVDALKVAFGEALLPVLIKLVQFVTPFVKGITSMTIATEGFIERFAQITGIKTIIAPLIGPLVVFGNVIGAIFSTIQLSRWAGGLKILAGVPGPLRLIGVALTLLGVAATPIGPILSTIITALTVVQGIKWAASFVGGVGTVVSALTGFLGFLTGTVAPALVAIFSGPAGWTVLAVAAVVAMAVAFREPIGQFLAWLGPAMINGFTAAWEGIKKGASEATKWLSMQWQAISTGFMNGVVVPIGNGWNALVTALPSAMSTTAAAVANIWNGVMNTIRSAVNNVISSIVGGINQAINGINNLIAGLNRLPGPGVPFVPNVNVPRFAKGGYVTSRTLAEIGEGGEPEYVVPKSKATSFANNILSGTTGAAALKKSTRTLALETLAADPQAWIRAADAFAPKGGWRTPTEKRFGRIRAAESLGFKIGPSSAFGGGGTTIMKSVNPIAIRRALQSQSQGGSSGMSISQPVSVAIQTGPVQRRKDGDFVTLSDLERAVGAAVDQTMASFGKASRQPSYRRRTGSR